ncbi:MAG: ATP-dependent RNA helicase RhlE [Flavobacteriales bacterium CG_4_9_14_3_um_filter_32_8]|nr:MAG: ATP-dependent RNA helicase RhlE [Flavobacteriales bacterium CG_4_9_14_3_um_filter_32_8]
MSFNSLGLADAILKAVSTQGYSTPTPIQKKVIPVILEGKDVLASAQTGTGKTAGFTLPILQILTSGQQLRNRPIRSLILTPTRELAAQIFENVKDYSKFLDIKPAVIFGGVNQNPQVQTLRSGVDILIATPGRLLDLQNQGLLSLAKVEILVLDEADRMLDMGFLRDIKKILNILPIKRQNLLFSATFSKEIKQLAQGILNHPITVEATPGNTTAEMVNHKIYRVDKGKKTELIIKLIMDGNWQQVLVFTRTKHGANKLCEKMQKKGLTAAAIHGNKTQGARTKALAGFKDAAIRVLVATDIAARGLDIPLLPHVVNFELPNISEDYIHRIGRTGRAGSSGDAISLVSHDEEEYVKGIEKLLGHRLTSEVIPGFEQSVMSRQELEAVIQANKQQQRPPSGNRDKTKRPSNRNNNRGRN